jgi:thymidylate synthase
MTHAEERQYLALVGRILQEGTPETTRNGPTRTTFGAMMRFSLADGRLPLVTQKRLAWKTCLTELLWFLRGRTDNQWLNARGVRIWDANATREFLDTRGLTENAVGDLGPIYGFQWRHFNGEYPSGRGGVAQLAGIIAAVRDPQQRASRRLIMTAWNPCQIPQMALPPCHVLCQFHVSAGDRLSCALYQRSGDVGLGVPFNIASYAALTHLIAAHCGLVAHEFVHFIGNAHIYEEHAALMEQMGARQLYEFPRLRIGQVRDNIDEYETDDFVVTGYEYDKTPLPLRMIA